MKFHLKRFLHISLAILLIFISAFLILSLLTYNSSDPSFFNLKINEGEVSNFFGIYGARISDLLLQSLGYSAFLIVLSIFSFALRIIYKTKNQKFIFVFLLYTIFIFSLLLSFSPKFITLNIGAGGVLGDYVKQILVNYIDSALLVMVLVILSLIGIYFTVGLSFKEWQELTLYLFKKIRKKIDYAPTKDKVGKKNVKSTHNSLPRVDILYLPNQKYKENIGTKDSNFNVEKAKLSKILSEYGVKGKIIGHSIGPVVTLYQFEPIAGTKASRVINLSDDIARSMTAISTRISVISGKNALGIEIPNIKRETVYLRELIESDLYKRNNYRLPIILGKDISGMPVIADLSKMPHLLVAGTTGSGKSVAINNMILSLLFSKTPEECNIVMIDPKMLELSVYDGIPHLLSPVVTDAKQAIIALRWVVQEMERRYKIMAALNVRNIESFNELISNAKNNNSEMKLIKNIGASQYGGDIEHKPFSYIVVIVDEMADLMLVAGKEIEAHIQRIAQMARASGIHIIMATQRPSVDVITGVIKANFPTRISFNVTSKIDSRTILGEQGAEQLLGMGDMLYMKQGGNITRVHAPFVSDGEVENVVKSIRGNSKNIYQVDFSKVDVEEYREQASIDDSDDLYHQAVKLVLEEKRATTSYIQRRFRIGYNKAASLIERMEKERVVTPPNSQGKREIIQ